MKILQTLWIVTLCLCANCEATSKGSSKLNVVYFLENSLRGKLTNQLLPSNWDEIEPVVEIRKMDPRGWLFDMRTINSFALVPEAPLIIKESGISYEYYGKRLFLISRAEDVVPPDSRGRCVILIDPEGTDPKTMRTYSYFIPETTAQLILRQLKGFDPKKTPVAFENLPEIEKRFKAEKKEFEDFAASLDDRPKQGTGTDLPYRPSNADATRPSPASHVSPQSHSWWLWLLAITGVGVLFIWAITRKNRKP